MLPGGFKKDSRIWLHKNAHVFPKHTPALGIQGVGSDDPYEQLLEDPFYNQSHVIRDESGRVFKKDSRTWLHKSSLKNLAKSAPNGTHRLVSSRRQPWENCELSDNDKFSGEGVIRTRSSTEMVRVQNGVNKMKKKKRAPGLTADGVFAPSLDFRSVKEQPAKENSWHGGDLTPQTRKFPQTFLVRNKQPGASFHCIAKAKKGNFEVSAYASDFCIVGKPNLVQKDSVYRDWAHRDLLNSNSASETEEDLGDDSADGTRLQPGDVLDKGVVMADYPLCCVNDGGCTGVGYTTTNVEFTKDGLRELELMMVEQSRRRSLRLTKHRHEVGRRGTPLEVSPETESSDSKIGLDACINLSDELICGRELCQPQNSTDQLTTATECLHVYSPPTDQTTATECLHVYSPPTDQTTATEYLHVYSPPTDQTSATEYLRVYSPPTDQTTATEYLRVYSPPTDQTSATEYLHVYSPPTDQTTATECLHVYSPPTDPKIAHGEVE